VKRIGHEIQQAKRWKIIFTSLHGGNLGVCFEWCFSQVRKSTAQTGELYYAPMYTFTQFNRNSPPVEKNNWDKVGHTCHSMSSKPSAKQQLDAHDWHVTFEK
jgi:hypothetical protein